MGNSSPNPSNSLENNAESKAQDKTTIYEYSKNGTKKVIDETGQDETQIIQDLGQGLKFLAVFDGHGFHGKASAQLAKETIHSILTKEKNMLSKIETYYDAELYFKRVFTKIQSKFIKNSQEFELSGTCFIGAFIKNDHCFVINLGDSRAALGLKDNLGKKVAYQMSTDHKASINAEKKRIESNGGQLVSERNGIMRIYSKTEEGPGLAVSRTLGDILGHKIGVTCEPEVTYKLIDSYDKFLVCASDGVWDVMNTNEVVGFIFEKLNTMGKEKIPEALVWECRQRWEVINLYKQKLNLQKQNENQNEKQNPKDSPSKNTKVNYSIDDISCVIAFFDKENEKLKIIKDDTMSNKEF